MCGICGINGLGFDEKNRYAESMLKTLYHRGPDEEGRYVDREVLLGIRRLSIIDLKTGSQPIYNEDKHLVVVCNGEIYNFYKLREDLIKKGHNFYTNSDVEVIVHLYEQYGVDCLKHMKGMFSFALWDVHKKSLFLARDRLGIKPLYYYNKNGIFAFSSEPKALLKLPFINKELNIEALDLYLSLEYVPSPYSIFKDIHKLKPAHYILYRNKDIKIHRYWDLRKDNKYSNISISSAMDVFKELLTKSVKEHLVSDVPLGVFLSGGVDSTTLTALAGRLCSQRLSTFSIGFEDKSFDESDYALMAARHFGSRHYNYIFTITDFKDNFSSVMGILDEPFADMSIFPTYVLSKFSRNYIKVALSGEGADELFMGYPTYIAHRYVDLFGRFPKGCRRSFSFLVNSLPTSFKYFSLDFKLKQFVKGLDERDPVLRHLLWMTAFSAHERGMLAKEKITDNRENTVNDFVNSIRHDLKVKDTYKTIQYMDIFTYLSENLLVKADRASMLSSLELRVPYLDHNLVEFAWSLNYKLIYQKRLLKESMKGVLPRQILARPKKGFSVPFSSWLMDKRFFGVIEQFFDRGFIEKQGLFDQGYIGFLLNDHLAGKTDNRKKLRTYIMFQGWYRTWMENM